MKTIKDLFNLIAQATQENTEYNTWFIDCAGHVNKIKISHYKCGWKPDSITEERIEETLNEEGIQALYWFVKTRLK